MATDAVSERAAAMRLVGMGDVAGAMRTLQRLVETSNDPADRLLFGRMLSAPEHVNALLERFPTASGQAPVSAPGAASGLVPGTSGSRHG